MSGMFLYALLTTAALADDPVPAVVPASAPVVAPAPEATAPVAVPAPEVVPAVPAAAPVATPPATPVATPEVKVPETTGEALADGQKAFDAVQAGEWGTAIVLLLGVLAFVYNKFVRKAPAAPKA